MPTQAKHLTENWQSNPVIVLFVTGLESLSVAIKYYINSCWDKI